MRPLVLRGPSGQLLCHGAIAPGSAHLVVVDHSAQVNCRPASAISTGRVATSPAPMPLGMRTKPGMQSTAAKNSRREPRACDTAHAPQTTMAKPGSTLEAQCHQGLLTLKQASRLARTRGLNLPLAAVSERTRVPSARRPAALAELATQTAHRWSVQTAPAARSAHGCHCQHVASFACTCLLVPVVRSRRAKEIPRRRPYAARQSLHTVYTPLRLERFGQ